MKTSKASIKAFFEARKLAIAGVSRDPKKFGYSAFRKLKETGFDLYLIHPDTDILHGETCYRNISLLPGDISGLLVLTPKTETLGVVKDAVKKGIPNLWIQQMSDTPESIEYALSNKVNLVTGQCILMFAEPVRGFHKFHRNLKRLFGQLPK
jgi:predicted CoA-binding protein